MLQLMFGMLWAMLLLQIALHNTSVYSILAGSIAKETSRVSAESDDIVKRYWEVGSQEHHKERMQLQYQRMGNVRRRCRMTVHYLDSIANRIAEASGGYRNELQRLRYMEDRHWGKTVFKGRESVSAMLQVVDSLNEYMIRNTRPYGNRAYLRKNLPSKWCENGWNEQGLCRSDMQRFFHHSTAEAAIAMLIAIRQNIALAEKLTLEELYREGMPKIDNYDAIAALAVPTRSFAVPGTEVSANILIAGYNRYMNYHTSCSEGRIVRITNGIAIWKARPQHVGLHHVHGSIISDNDTAVKNVAWEFWYRSILPHASLQLDKMNVLYRGIENPVTISHAAGYDVKDLSVHIPHATVTTLSPGSYSILIKNPAVKRLHALIIHTDSRKKQDTISGMTIRIKDLPLPVATIGNEITRSLISIDELVLAHRLSVFSPDEDLQRPYTVLGYSLSYMRKGSDEIIGPITINGSGYGGDIRVQALLTQAATGDRIFFTGIKAAASDGTILSPADVHYRLR